MRLANNNCSESYSSWNCPDGTIEFLGGSNVSGFSSNQILRLELLKIFILTNMVSSLSIGMGVIIALILSEIINPNFFGWSIPIQVFPDYWLQTWLIALAASVFSTLLSFRSSNVKPISNFDVRNF